MPAKRRMSRRFSLWASRPASVRHRLESLCHQNKRSGATGWKACAARTRQVASEARECGGSAWLASKEPWARGLWHAFVHRGVLTEARRKRMLCREGTKRSACGAPERGGGVGSQPGHSFPSRLAIVCGAKSVPKPTRPLRGYREPHSGGPYSRVGFSLPKGPRKGIMVIRAGRRWERKAGGGIG